MYIGGGGGGGGGEEVSIHVHVHVWSIECRGFESHPRQLIFSRKSDCLGCAVLLCLVCLFDPAASFFLPSHLSFKNMYILTRYMHIQVTILGVLCCFALLFV